MKRIGTALFFFLAIGAALAQDYPAQADHDRRAVRRRRPDRHGGARARRRRWRKALGQHGDRRERRRRRRHASAPSKVANAQARRLHAAAPPHRHGDQRRRCTASCAYDPLNDFEYIGLVTDVPMTHRSRKQGLAAEGPEGAPRLRQGEQGQGHLRQRRHRRGVAPVRPAVHERDPDRLLTVPYKGTGPAMNDLLGGQVDFMCDQTTNTTGQIKGGKVKAYAVTTPKRVAVAARRADARGAGLQGLRGRHLARPLRAQGHAEAGDRQARRRAAGRAARTRPSRQRFADLGAEPVAADKRDARPRSGSTSRPRSTSGRRSSRRPACTPTEQPGRYACASRCATRCSRRCRSRGKCEFAARLGYDGLEIAPFTLSERPAAHRRRARSRRLRGVVEDAAWRSPGCTGCWSSPPACRSAAGRRGPDARRSTSCSA